jgi:hypothetical protein
MEKMLELNRSASLFSAHVASHNTQGTTDFGVGCLTQPTFLIYIFLVSNKHALEGFK